MTTMMSARSSAASAGPVPPDGGAETASEGDTSGEAAPSAALACGATIVPAVSMMSTSKVVLTRARMGDPPVVRLDPDRSGCRQVSRPDADGAAKDTSAARDGRHPEV